jgi:hypothetical protein
VIIATVLSGLIMTAIPLEEAACAEFRRGVPDSRTHGRAAAPNFDDP